MKKRRVVHDATFGELTHVVGDLWERPIRLQVFGREWTVPLSVDIDPHDGIEHIQILAFNAFSEATPTLVVAAETAVFDYYLSVCGEYRDRLGIRKEDDGSVPLIESVREVYKLVELEGLIFPYARSCPTFGILCKCTWEVEHGLGVKYERGKVVDVGFQDILL